MHWSTMSTILSVLHHVIGPALGISLLGAAEALLVAVPVVFLLVLFKPLLRGIARALVLVVRPKLSREQRLARRAVTV
jgi:hypothetical protein